MSFVKDVLSVVLAIGGSFRWAVGRAHSLRAARDGELGISILSPGFCPGTGVALPEFLFVAEADFLEAPARESATPTEEAMGRADLWRPARICCVQFTR